MRLLFFTPLVLLSHLLFFGWSEVVLDVEGLADFLGSFAFDHVGHSFASDIEKSLKYEMKIISKFVRNRVASLTYFMSRDVLFILNLF